MTLPVLYSFRRCPYAMRARMALAIAGVHLELREVVLRDKPESMLAVSSKGTVPVLVLDDQIIDESLDIMRWALQSPNTDDSLGLDGSDAAKLARQWALVDQWDLEFKPWLDRYKYADRHPQQPPETYRREGEAFIKRLDAQTSGDPSPWLFDQFSFVDVAIFPFVRQFAHVDKAWFDGTENSHVHVWLERLLSSRLFESIMQKYPQWQVDTLGEDFDPACYDLSV